MPISTKSLVDQINTKLLDASLTVTQAAQLAAATCAINNNVVTVSTVGDLPAASISTGRMIYVKSLCDYRYSNGASWVREYNSAAEYGSPVTVWAWGLNSSGHLGDNTTVNKSSPASVVGGFLDWCQVSAGFNNIAAITTTGTLWTWGGNNFGQLGDNTAVNKCSPVSVVGGFTDWCQVSARGHVAAVRTNGTLWTWGFGPSGQLGNNSIVSRSSPVSVVGGFTDWCQVSTGGNHTAAVRTNGTLWVWGNNGLGKLGDNTTVSKSSPVQVVGTDCWCRVSAGNNHTAAVKTTGSLWTWGSGSSGQLGNNTIVNRSSPVSVVGGFTDWCQVSAGENHTAAIRNNGSLWAWGLNDLGQLGDNNVSNRSSPVSVVGGFTDWCQVSSGYCHTAAIRTNGTLWTWGNNGTGQLGNNTIVSRSSPVSVVGGVTDWCQVSAGNGHTAAVGNSICRGF